MDKSQLAATIFDKHAYSYQDKFMDLHLYHRSFDVFCENVPKNGNVLELGCGPGNVTRYLLQIRPDLKILGTDLAPTMIQLAKANNPTAEFEILDCREIGSIGRTYDAVIGGFCLPYLSKQEAVKLIEDAAELLNPRGVLYFSTMERDDQHESGWKSGSQGDQVYMNYHDADYLISVFEHNNLKIRSFTKQPYMEKDGSTTTDLILIAIKE